MKKTIIILVICAMFLLSACNNANTETVEENDKAQLNTQEQSDMDLLADNIRTCEKMSIFLSEGLDKQDDMNLNMHMVNHLYAYGSLFNLYDGYTSHGAEYENPYDNKENKTYSVYKTFSDERVYSYSLISYVYDDRSTVNSDTTVTFDANKNLAESKIRIIGGESNSIQQYYFNGGTMCIVRSQLAYGSLICDVMYYDGEFFGAAMVTYQDQTELRPLYDLTGQTPSKFEDLLTEDSYDLYFTYDGENCVYENN